MIRIKFSNRFLDRSSVLVNLRNPLHTANKAHKQGNPPWLETHDRRKSKTMISVVTQKGLMSSEIFFLKSFSTDLTKSVIKSRSSSSVTTTRSPPSLIQLCLLSSKSFWDESNQYLWFRKISDAVASQTKKNENKPLICI